MTGDFSRYNDYELIYLVNTGVEEALDVMIWKYSYLIKARISNYNVPNQYKEEYYQEGLLMLLKAINTFDDSQHIPFTTYFDILLKRRFATLLRKMSTEKFDYLDDLDVIAQTESSDLSFKEELNKAQFTPFEQAIYDGFFVNNLSCKQISNMLEASPKSVSNAKQRVLKKLRLAHISVYRTI